MTKANNITIIYALDEYSEVDPTLNEKATKIAKERKLGITRDRELKYVAMEEGEVVGAAWTAFDGENYEFDVAVAQGHDRKGIGRALVKAVIDERDFVCEGVENATMLVPVTSPGMCRLLEKEGFIVTDVPAKGFVTMGLSDECEPYKGLVSSLNSDESFSP